MIASYNLWQYAHILLFVYWLGADLGVFLASRYVARADLPTAERLRFLELTLKIDMGPRTALIMMIPVGFVLADQQGIAPFIEGWLPLAWLLACSWLALTWYLYLRPTQPSNAALAKLDRIVRITVATGFAVVGLLSLVAADPLAAPLQAAWLAAKFMLFAVVIVLGLLLRGIIREWAGGFAELRAGTNIDQANSRIAVAQRMATRFAYLLWLCVLLIAFLGVTKPAFDG